MQIVYAVLCGFVLDMLLADPRWLPHPVVYMGKCITFLEKFLRKRFPDTDQGAFRAGLIMAVILPLGTLLVSGGILYLLWRIHPILRFIVETFWCYQALAVRGMAKEGWNVHKKLTEGTLDEAREAVGRIVGRDTDRLSEQGVIKAAVESIAESFSDGVVAPMIFLILGGAPLGLCYKAINTMDSMVGYRNERYLYFGRAAARLDDAANLIPSRAAAWILLLAVGITHHDMRQAFRIWRRDRRNHPSPNSGQTESVMAGALRTQLAGPASYGGVVYLKPTIGDELHHVEPTDILRANQMFYVGSVLALMLLCLIRAACFLR